MGNRNKRTERLNRLQLRCEVRAARVIQRWMRTEVWPKHEAKMLHSIITIQM